VDLLDEIVRELKQKNKDVSAEADSDDEDEPVDVLATPLAELEKPRRKRKKKLPKYQAPGYIFILDDMSRLLREPSITEFLKMHRHFKAKIIISSQYPNDILPESWLQLDYIILFKGHPDKKLEEIYKVADIPISLNRFIQLYKFATMARPKNRVFLKENRPPFSKSAPQGVGRAARTLGRVTIRGTSMSRLITSEYYCMSSRKQLMILDIGPLALRFSSSLKSTTKISMISTM